MALSDFKCNQALTERYEKINLVTIVFFAFFIKYRKLCKQIEFYMFFSLVPIHESSFGEYLKQGSDV